ncbi:MAG: molybdenum cofactor biosynthesis protein MoaE [Verrucomicrobiae bacterium]|nr:molybdenum cofactor biosynthesis protein MoaE [Verrucomicrobiae bacterium]
MQLDLRLTDSPIPYPPRPWPNDTGAGAVAEFYGIVRGVEEGRALRALRYEAYADMAEREIRRLLGELAARHPCRRVAVIHRLGLVPVGEAAIYVRVESAHRAEAFALLQDFMDRLKQEVPIWKAEAIPQTQAGA